MKNFFILGSGRNGSTLLASILNGHNNLFVPPEQFVLPYSIMQRYLVFYETVFTWKNRVINMFGEDRKTLNWEVNLDNIDIDNKDVSGLFNKIYMNYACQQKKNVSMWGDKTPINIHFIDFIYPEFNNSKYIFLIRDARDVICSYKKLHGHKASDTVYAIWKWKDSIRKLKRLQINNDVLILRYEDLVLDPRKEVKNILKYLEVEDDDNLINYENNGSNMGVSDKPHHQNLDKPISSRSVGKWKEKLASKDVDLVNKECSAYLKEFGYFI